MSVDLDWAASELGRAKTAVRRLHREVARARDMQLARLELAAGEPMDERQVCDFLRRARGSDLQGVVITVSQA